MPAPAPAGAFRRRPVLPAVHRPWRDAPCRPAAGARSRIARVRLAAPAAGDRSTAVAPLGPVSREDGDALGLMAWLPDPGDPGSAEVGVRSEEHTSGLPSLMRKPNSVFSL